MVDVRPNLFIIGAMKSGTTSLHSYLHSHPDIFMSSPKELKHFLKTEYSSKGHSEYLSFFAGSEDMRYRGESSTDYTKLPFFPNVAKRIYDFNAEIRLIYLMREPFERSVSQYRHQVRMGRESRKLFAALNSPSDYLTNSHYAMQLRPYFDLFGKDSVFLCTFEVFIKEPQSICSQIFKWLEIDSSFVPPNLGTRYFESPTRIWNMRQDSLMYRFRSIAQKSNLISRLLPAAIKGLYDKMTPKYLALDSGSESFKRDVDEARGRLRRLFNDWRAELAEITSLSFPEWEDRSRNDPYSPFARSSLRRT
jgi:hypothetical protein